MTASEFAFLALGLLLGIATGAALMEVLRARPAASREVRVTVAPNSIPRRATTLADDAFASGASEPARGGPADRRWIDREPASSGDVLTATAELVGMPLPDDAIRTPVPVAGESGPFRLTRHVAGSSGFGSGRESEAVSIAREADPMLTALRATAAATATAAMRKQRIATLTDPPRSAIEMALPPETPTGSLDEAWPATSSDEPRAGSARDPTRGPGGIRDPDARPDPSGPSASGGSSMNRSRRGADQGSGAPEPGAGQPARAPDMIDAVAAAAARVARARAAETPIVATAGTDADVAPKGFSASAPDPTGPCADQRRVADERCAIAGRAGASAEAAVDALRAAQRAYDDHVSRSERAAATADPRSVRAAKEAAQESFRAARGKAGSHMDVESAARDWLTEINRINMLTRDSLQQAERDRAAATELAHALERLGVEADAARITAEAATEACVAAREAVAACEEGVAMGAPGPVPAPAAARAAAPAAAPAAGLGLGGAVDEIDEDVGTMASRAGQDAAIIRLLRGDHEVLQRTVASLAGDDPVEQRRWQMALTGLLEALIARSIEASAFDFPTDHPFWGPFSRSQNREIAGALASLGYRHDGFGGWVDERVPTQRDLSLAVGYAGLDPMRVRHWPPEPEMRELMSEVTVTADEYVWDAAGTLTLGDLITLLGRRADALTDLWNDWGAVRPLLLSAE